jgi:iron complex outermembrane receptor protein
VTSNIELRGLGPDGTLILVDGRRLPNVPDAALRFMQPDINPIASEAIGRVETMTGTAGGIYGFGALGGVVNVVLKRDYRGAELSVTRGISGRGDAARLRMAGRLGFTPDHGQTEIMLSASRSTARALSVGDRPDTVRNREIGYRLAPDYVVNNLQLQHAGSSIGVFNSSYREPLKLKAAYGGSTLASDHTFLALGSDGNVAAVADQLAAHAGMVDLSLNQGEAQSDLAPVARMTNAILNVRHRFADGIEAYADALILSNHGRRVTHGAPTILLLSPDDLADLSSAG